MTVKKTQRATASDVAAQAGVSKWTVSRAFTPGASISDSAREKVLAAAEALGYRPNLLARSLKNKQSRLIGIVMDELRNPHSMMMLDSVTRELQSRGYIGLVLNIASGENYQYVMGMADQLQVDGILFLGNALTPELIHMANELHNVPLVQLCRNAEEPGISVVNIDGYQAGQQIARLLMKLGCQRFGYMKGPDTESTHLLRLDGYRDALEDAGYTLSCILTAGHYERQLGFRQIQHYLQETEDADRIDALFCENDILALGALSALRQANAEQQMALIGFDDIDEASDPEWQLTSWSQRLDKLVHEAANRLIDGQAQADGDWKNGELRLRRTHLRKR